MFIISGEILDKSGFQATAYRGGDLYNALDESSSLSYWHNPSDSTPGEIQWYQVWGSNQWLCSFRIECDPFLYE